MKKGNLARRPKVTREQVRRRTLHPESLAFRTEDIPRPEGAAAEAPNNSYAASKAKFAASLRNRFGDDWICDHPLINPRRIIEEAQDRPMSAAIMCKQACVLLNVGNHERVHELLVAGYSIACGFKSRSSQIGLLAAEMSDARSLRPIKAEFIEQKLLLYVFIYIFFESGMITKDRAYQYAQSLQYYFDRNETVEDIDKVLKKHGQNKLRIAAQRRTNILKGAREWAEQGKNPTSVTMEEVLAAMAAEKIKSGKAVTEGESADLSPRDIDPCDLKYRAEVAKLDDDADWLDDNDPERNPKASVFKIENDEADPREDHGAEVTQPPEVDEFFNDMMRLTAEMIAGLSDQRIDLLKREAMVSLVRHLWIKVMHFRGLLA